MATVKNGVIKVPFRNINVGTFQRFAAEQGVSITADEDGHCFIFTLHPKDIQVANS